MGLHLSVDLILSYFEVCITSEFLLCSENQVVSTQCLPTGVWDGIENVQCNKKCSKLPSSAGIMYNPPRSVFYLTCFFIQVYFIKVFQCWRL